MNPEQLPKKSREEVGRWLLPALLLLLVFWTGSSYWVYQKIQQRADISIRGRWMPQLRFSAFRVQNAVFVWKDRVEFLGGDINVRYHFWTYLVSGNIPVKITSRQAKIKLLGAWAQMQGVSQAALDTVNLEFVLGRDGIQDIRTIEVKGPAFHFSLRTP